MLSPLCRGWVFKGYGTVPGLLYDFGAYPGAVSTEEAGRRILGELYELPNPKTMIPQIDRYEGCSDEDERPHEFERELVDVDMRYGSVVRAWIYWYRPFPRGRTLESGDYLERADPHRPA